MAEVIESRVARRMSYISRVQLIGGCRACCERTLLGYSECTSHRQKCRPEL